MPTDEPSDRTPYLDRLRVFEDRARRWMPQSDIHGVLEVEQCLGVTYTAEQVRRVAAHPFGQYVLRACRGNFVLVAGFPLSIPDLRARFPSHFLNLPAVGADEFCWDARVDLRWHLVRKAEVPGSQDKTLREQLRLLQSWEEVPRACGVVYASVVHQLVTGERIPRNVGVRCSDVVRPGRRLTVIPCWAVIGADGGHPLFLSTQWDEWGRDCLGLACAHKKTW